MTRFVSKIPAGGDAAERLKSAGEGVAPQRLSSLRFEPSVGKLIAFRASCTLALTGALFSPFALAAEADIKLKAAPGVEVVQRNCMVCHSADYIPMNSPFGDRKAWETEVNKMINAFGAQVPKEDVEVILQYLVQNYGAAPAAQTQK